MRNIVDSFVAHVAATAEREAHSVRVFISDVIIPHKDKVILKHLVNSDVDIMSLSDMDEARALYNDLDANCKLVTSQEGVNIRYERWYPSKASEDNGKDYGPTEDPSVDPDAIYNEGVVKAIADILLPWCRTRQFQSFVSYDMLTSAVAQALYGNGEHKALALDEQQQAMVCFVKNRFAARYCVISPFNDKGYNLGSEMMNLMYPNGVKYRAEKFTKGNRKGETTYFFVFADAIVNPRNNKKTSIPASTFGERSALRLKIDTELYFSGRV